MLDADNLLPEELEQMTELLRKKFGKIWDKVKTEALQYPRIAMEGKTGVGKSSLINALFGKEVAKKGVNPTTEEIKEFRWPDDKFVILDTPGFGDIDEPDVKKALLDLVKEKVSLVLVILNGAERAYQDDKEFLVELGNVVELEKAIVVNRMDLLPPAREWKPPYNLSSFKESSCEKENNMRQRMKYVHDHFRTFTNNIIPVSAGESPEDAWNIKELTETIYRLLPKGQRIRLLATAKHAEELRRTHAWGIISRVAVEAGIIAAIPIPVADLPIMLAAQSEMVISLAALYNQALTWKTALSLLGTSGLGFGLREVFRQALKFIPAVGGFVGIPIAVGGTILIGFSVMKLFEAGKKLSKENLEETMRKVRDSDEFKKAKEDIVKKVKEDKEKEKKSEELKKEV